MRCWARSRRGVDVIEEEPRIEAGYPDVDSSIVGCDPIDIENLKNLGFAVIATGCFSQSFRLSSE
jgi:hypothetical protein